jgi:hypothetical protein
MARAFAVLLYCNLTVSYSTVRGNLTVSYCTVILPHVALAHDSRSVCPCDREASHWAPLPLTYRRIAVRDRPGEKTTHPAVWLSAWLRVWRGILIMLSLRLSFRCRTVL